MATALLVLPCPCRRSIGFALSLPAAARRLLGKRGRLSRCDLRGERTNPKERGAQPRAAGAHHHMATHSHQQKQGAFLFLLENPPWQKLI